MTNDVLQEKQLTVPDGYVRVNWRAGFAQQVGPLYEKDVDQPSFRRAFRVSDHHTNGMGNCHGGMLMAFADIAFGHAVTVALGRYWVTVRLLTDFVAAAHLGDWVEGTAEMTGEAEGFVTVKGRIWVGDKTLMVGSGVFKALGERP